MDDDDEADELSLTVNDAVHLPDPATVTFSCASYEMGVSNIVLTAVQVTNLVVQ